MADQLRELSRKAERAIDRAVYRFGQIEMAESQKLVPVDTGTLKNSGYVDKPKRTAGGSVSLELGYGGAAEAYAVYVHEDTEAFHSVGQSHFLSQPLNESAPFFAERVGRDVATDLGM